MKKRISGYAITAIAIVAAKELFMVVGGLLMLSRNVVVFSNIVGKTAQVFFILSLILSFFHEELEAWGTRLDLIFLWITVGISLLAMIIYIVGAVKTLMDRKRKQT